MLGGLNTYTGQTQIISGTLEPVSVSALGVGPSIAGNFSLPLFSMPSGRAVDPAIIPVPHSLQNYKATVITTDLGGSRTLFSAQLTFQGSVMMLPYSDVFGRGDTPVPVCKDRRGLATRFHDRRDLKSA